ncbi:MAG TPA: hypothetical protein VG708_05100 [Mycobacteriales bacterium]|nr:hypothetical protein [Mycobacteriales bacterium]
MTETSPTRIHISPRFWRKRTSGVALAAVAVIAATGIGVAATSHASASPQAPTQATAVDSTTVLDTSDGLTLAPPTDAIGSISPQLSADAAWAKYAAAAGVTEPTVPAGLSVQLGSLTLPVSIYVPASEQTNVVNHELSYAYSLPGVGCQTTLPSQAASGTECTEWTFLDANTGEHVLTMFQPNPGAGTAQARSAVTVSQCRAARNATQHTLLLRRGVHRARTVHVSKGDVVRVRARLRGYRMGIPHAVTHRSAVCKIRARRGSHGRATAWFKALHTKRVRFASVAESRSGPPNPLALGYAKITS